MLKELKVLLKEREIPFKYRNNHIACFPHIVNLCTQRIIAALTNPNLIGTNDDENDDDELFDSDSEDSEADLKSDVSDPQADDSDSDDPEDDPKGKFATSKKS
jgi:hypothetical protein